MKKSLSIISIILDVVCEVLLLPFHVMKAIADIVAELKKIIFSPLNRLAFRQGDYFLSPYCLISTKTFAGSVDFFAFFPRDFFAVSGGYLSGLDRAIAVPCFQPASKEDRFSGVSNLIALLWYAVA